MPGDRTPLRGLRPRGRAAAPFPARPLAVALLWAAAGCVSDRVDTDDFTGRYQQAVLERAPQERLGADGLESLVPAREPQMPELRVDTDEATGRPVVALSVEDALRRALAGSPEITVTSYDPSIAKEELAKAASAFDVIAFGRFNYNDQNNPTDSIFQGGEATSRAWEAGVKQRLVTGAEWSLSYTLARTWDDLTTRVLDERWEPFVAFEIRQPLLRDAWPDANLAGVDIAELNYRVALAGFRQRAEDVSTEVIGGYWLLWQARRDVEIQRDLLRETLDTLRRVRDRKDIDASSVQIKQAEAFAKSREAELFQADKRARDIQDALLRLISDNQLNVASDLDVVAVSEPATESREFDPEDILTRAVERNPQILAARFNVEIAGVNVRVAERQRLGRLDLVASGRLTGLSDTIGEAHDDITEGRYVTYGVGVTFEYPLGNREREAELRRRKLERAQSVTVLQNVSDQVAAEAKERIRRAEVAQEEMRLQHEAVEAAAVYLQALEDTEKIRERLTPEFILLKLQAQELLANARRAENQAVVDYNVSLTRLAQSTGSVLEMRAVREALPALSGEEGGPAAGSGTAEP